MDVLRDRCRHVSFGRADADQYGAARRCSDPSSIDASIDPHIDAVPQFTCDG
jgi:hypothetical protein